MKIKTNIDDTIVDVIYEIDDNDNVFVKSITVIDDLMIEFNDLSERQKSNLITNIKEH